MNTAFIAKVAHQVNKAYCESIGDYSQIDWEEAPDWQRDSAIGGVKFHLRNPETTPEESHISWLQQKEADGWKYGKVKDTEKKIHPCFLPYADLPSEQKTKDFLFSAVVKSLR